MHIVGTNMTVVDYCRGLEQNTIVVNREYQRSSEVWPAAAQSFLIESMLLDFPVPKLALYQITDRETRTSRREIVDGQQRTEAIRQFYDGNLRLSRTLEFEDAAGRTYGELSDELQDKFLAYALAFDLFVDATPRDVREVFRRINSYEVPLNAEEQRHAKYQGDFKWFIYHLSHSRDEDFLDIGTFTQKQLVRMADMKLLTEIVHTMLYGVTTTTKRSLDKLYADSDEDFSDYEEDFTERINSALDFIRDLDDLHRTALMKPYIMYSLLLAIMHADGGVEALTDLAPGQSGLADPEDAARALSTLAEALEVDAPPRKVEKFVTATEKATNTKANRETRIRFLYDAVSA